MTVRIPGTQIKLNGKTTISIGALLLAISGLLANYVWAQVQQVPGLIQWKEDHTESTTKNLRTIENQLDAAADDRQVIRESIDMFHADSAEWRTGQNQWNQLFLEDIREMRRETNAKLDKLLERSP